MIFLNRLLIIIVGILTSGCVSDLPIRTVRDGAPTEETTANEQIPVTTAPPVTAPSPAPPPLADEPQRHEEIKTVDSELEKYAYELGFNPKKQLTEKEKKQILDRKVLRELERSLDSLPERRQYSRVIPWLKDDQEKIELLSIPGVEGRQVWINKNKIWSRAKSLQEFDEIVENQDIAIGMPAEYVKKSWGEPDQIETSGNPIYRNERWQFNKQISTPQGYKQEKRYVYFEGGRVVGWETE